MIMIGGVRRPCAVIYCWQLPKIALENSRWVIIYCTPPIAHAISDAIYPRIDDYGNVAERAIDQSEITRFRLLTSSSSFAGAHQRRPGKKDVNGRKRESDFTLVFVCEDQENKNIRRSSSWLTQSFRNFIW